MQPVLQVHRIWTEYKPDPRDPAKMTEVDLVSFGPIGAADRNVTVERVSRLAKVAVDDGSGNPAVLMAKARWETIRPLYEAYKAGREVVQDGTPIAAWNAVSPEQAEMLRMRGIHTIEQLSGLTDAHISRWGLPGLKSLVEMAGVYLKSADTTRVTAELSSLQDENQALREQLAELSALVKEKLADADERPNKRK